MKIGILQTAYKKAEDYGAFYNVQELGLARALAGLGHEVHLYKAVDGKSDTRTECDGKLEISLVSVRYFGINGMIDVPCLDSSLEVLVYFCDTQIKVPSVYKWCKKNSVRFIPYIGVVESHSENAIKRKIMDFLTNRNLAIYRNCKVLAKTPAMKKKLEELGCNDTVLFPVGLDESVMWQGSVDDRPKCDYPTILFIGRMEEEKQPFEMIRLYEEALSVNKSIKLIMIGDGYLFEETNNRLSELSQRLQLAEGQVQLIRKVPYSQMHSYYHMADIYVNLNQVEILGMSILEAMYYGCPVLAIDAPGPEFILRDDEDYCGMVAPEMEDLEQVLKLFAKGDLGQEEIDRLTSKAKARVMKDYVWKALAGKLESLLAE